MTTVLDQEKPSAHAKLSPSSSARWLVCPGSIQAQASLPDANEDQSNEHSRLGTAAHALLEACLVIGAEPESYIGMHLAGFDHPAVDDDMCDAVQVALDYVEEYVDTYGESNLVLLPETRVPIGPQFDLDAELCSGTSDVIIAHNDRSMCTVIDYKHGAGMKVSAKENTQCMLYAAGARELFGAFKKYRIVIVQPRARKKSSVDEWEVTDAHLRKFLSGRVHPAAHAALRHDAPRVAGDHCRNTFCRASATCREFRRKVMSVARVEFGALDDEPDPDVIGPDEYAEILEHADLIENWLHVVRGHALRLLERDDKAIPGWTVGWSNRRREWDDEAGVIEYCQLHDIDEDKYAPRELLSPAKMITLLKRLQRPPGRRKRKADATTETNPVDAFIRYSVPKLKLVREGEVDEFDPIDDE